MTDEELKAELKEIDRRLRVLEYDKHRYNDIFYEYNCKLNSKQSQINVIRYDLKDLDKKIQEDIDRIKEYLSNKLKKDG
jgi:tRNA1(Val) A37 N6-methylase TrmN6